MAKHVADIKSRSKAHTTEKMMLKLRTQPDYREGKNKGTHKANKNNT